MSSYLKGNSVLVDFTFYVEDVPGDFTTAHPADPTTVTFYVRSPDNDLLTYVFGIAGEVTNPSVGRYILELNATVLNISNLWTYEVRGTGAVVAAGEGEFNINPSSTLDPTVSEPGFLPCQLWCDEEDVAQQCGGAAGSDWTKYTSACKAASELLYQLSGRQFSGICRETVRPFNDGCGCWAWIVSPASPGVPQWPIGIPWGWGGWGGGWGWGFDGCGSSLGCGPLSRVLLPGYPVTSIVSVEIAGETLDEAEYRLDGYQWLTRMNDADNNAQFWPGCQNISRPLGEPGTWGVSLTHGQAPPVSGQMAATELACEIYRASNGEDCKLPPGATQAIRQGITIQLAPFRAWGQINGQWATGLYMVDLFLAGFNPQGIRRQAVVWSPDDPPYAAKLGTGTGV